jgi:hypothetical protein
MKLLNFNIVFHKNLYKSNTDGFTPDELRAWFTFVAVNEQIVKRDYEWLKDQNVIAEYELDHYNPAYQMLHYQQNSVFFHFAKIRHNTRYIGFGQYDMSIHAPGFRECVALLNQPCDRVIAFYAYSLTDTLRYSVWDVRQWQEIFFDSYRDFYGIAHTLDSLQDMPVALLHTFIMPTWLYLHMMPFVEQLMPKILQGLRFDTRHLAGTLERVFAFCINCFVLEHKVKELCFVKCMEHVEAQHTGDPVRNIAAGAAST